MTTRCMAVVFTKNGYQKTKNICGRATVDGLLCCVAHADPRGRCLRCAKRKVPGQLVCVSHGRAGVHRVPINVQPRVSAEYVKTCVSVLTSKSKILEHVYVTDFFTKIGVGNKPLLEAKELIGTKDVEIVKMLRERVSKLGDVWLTFVEPPRFDSFGYVVAKGILTDLRGEDYYVPIIANSKGCSIEYFGAHYHVTTPRFAYTFPLPFYRQGKRVVQQLYDCVPTVNIPAPDMVGEAMHGYVDHIDRIVEITDAALKINSGEYTETYILLMRLLKELKRRGYGMSRMYQMVSKFLTIRNAQHIVFEE